MRYRDKKRLSLRLLLFCSVYTLIILFIIYYNGDKTTTVTTNINGVKSIESFRIKNNENNNNYFKGKISYISKSYLNCLDNNNKILNNKYKDSLYGEVLILKTNNYYSCYSIIKVSTNDNQYFYGIVLDRDSKQDLNSLEIIGSKEISNLNNKKNITYKIERFGI